MTQENKQRPGCGFQLADCRLLIANRGEIAVRIARAAAGVGMESVVVYSRDDADALHRSAGTAAVALSGEGPAAYLDAEQLVRIAGDSGCTVLHPGYGFLSESAEFARLCEQQKLVFVGPSPDLLQLFGDKANARTFAEKLGVPVLPGTAGAADLQQARAFCRKWARQGNTDVMIKALSGGGGRGIRRLPASCDAAQLESAWKSCQREARAAFGDDRLYLEVAVDQARHLEVQLIGDRYGQVRHLGERECSLQRSHQKIVEVAPAPHLEESVRQQMLQAAVSAGRHSGLTGLATAEFLLWEKGKGVGEGRFAFMEMNPRLQVEHRVTEEVWDIDLVQAQLHLAAGASVEESLGKASAGAVAPAGWAVQLRICAETLDAKGQALPATGRIDRLTLPTGPGISVDTAVQTGSELNGRFDSLLAKVICRQRGGDIGSAVAAAVRALGETRIEGLDSNIGLLSALLTHAQVKEGKWHNRLVTELLPQLAAAASPPASGSDGSDCAAPTAGVVLSLEAAPGEWVAAGQTLVVLEAMKMEHLVCADRAGQVEEVCVAAGDSVQRDQLLLRLRPATQEQAQAQTAVGETAADLEHIRPDLQQVLERHALGMDEQRPEAVARRRRTGQRTARENLADLCDAQTFIEYAPLTIAAQRRRRSEEDLIRRTPADGMVAGIGQVNPELFGAHNSRCVVMSYDYTVLAGTQGLQNHRKKDRLFELAHRWKLPVVLLAEGGGGRPGDTDGVGVAGLDCLAFQYFAALSGHVPLVGVVSGRCFAGNAALLGCCDVVIATADANIGMGGPAMIEGGGLGVFRPEQIGPAEVQRANGVIDLAVEDEVQAMQMARRYLAYFQGRLTGGRLTGDQLTGGRLAEGDCADQRLLRHAIPENRRRIYDIRPVIHTLADTDSVLELRADFAPGMLTFLIRMGGRSVGVIANNPAVQAGAIESDGADKASRFMQLCDAFGIPLLFLCDTPGIMVGPEAEKTALVRHAARMFVTGASLRVPFFTVVLRKAYGLGAQAMAGGSFKAPVFSVAWPTGEFGGMGLEGAVQLGYRKELQAETDPRQRQKLYEEMVDRMYQRGKALNVASHFEFDDVIDPADTRRWILQGLETTAGQAGGGDGRLCIDPW